ncbi:MAG: hypothetical protein ACPG4P_04285 [Flavobacteriaceae bacterium]|jgi:hypothetical protein
MKKSTWNPLFLVLFTLNGALSFGQATNLIVKQDPRIDSLLAIKIELDRARFANSYFTLQLYYGDLKTAEVLLDSAKNTYPHLPVELSFETPNYKVQAGRFKDKIRGLKTLDTVKRNFPSAFLLTRREE